MRQRKTPLPPRLPPDPLRGGGQRAIPQLVGFASSITFKIRNTLLL
jgi:hypothetical protein